MTPFMEGLISALTIGNTIILWMTLYKLKPFGKEYDKKHLEEKEKC